MKKIKDSDEVTKLPNGLYRISLRFTKAEAAALYEACNLASDVAGRPLSIDQALHLMLETFLEQNDPEWTVPLAE